VLTYPLLDGVRGITRGRAHEERKDEFSKEKVAVECVWPGNRRCAQDAAGPALSHDPSLHQTSTEEIKDAWKDYPTSSN